MWNTSFASDSVNDLNNGVVELSKDGFQYSKRIVVDGSIASTLAAVLSEAEAGYALHILKQTNDANLTSQMNSVANPQ